MVYMSQAFAEIRHFRKFLKCLGNWGNPRHFRKCLGNWGNFWFFLIQNHQFCTRKHSVSSNLIHLFHSKQNKKFFWHLKMSTSDLFGEMARQLFPAKVIGKSPVVATLKFWMPIWWIINRECIKHYRESKV